MKYFDAITIAMLLYLVIILTTTFFQAYGAGGVIEVHINEYGEAPYEAVILVIALTCGFITLVRSLMRLR